MYIVPSMQLLARHPLGLKSLWDCPPTRDESLLFSTWKVRPEGEVQRVIDYIWCAWFMECAIRASQLPTDKSFYVEDTTMPSIAC